MKNALHNALVLIKYFRIRREMNDEEIMRKRKWRVRTHGCKYPLHPWQISSWIFYLFNISGYYLVIMVSIKH